MQNLRSAKAKINRVESSAMYSENYRDSILGKAAAPLPAADATVNDRKDDQ